MEINFENMKNTIVSAGKSVAAKAKETSDIVKLKMDIHTKEDFISKQYTLLGKLYFEKHADDAEEQNVEESVLDCIRAIKEAVRIVEDLEQQVMVAKGDIKCQSCGAVQSQENDFCKACGAKLEKPEKQEEGTVDKAPEDTAEKAEEDVCKEAEEVAEAAEEAVAEEVAEAPEEVVCEVTGEAVDEAAEEAVCEVTEEAVDEAPEEAVCEVTEEAAEEAVCEVTAEAVDEATEEVVCEATEEAVDEAAEEVVDAVDEITVDAVEDIVENAVDFVETEAVDITEAANETVEWHFDEGPKCTEE